jgi:hypothetical protein
LHLFLPCASFVTIPGRISTSWPSRRTPVRIEPPATPPLRSSTSAPGLLTSNERMTISRGSEVKSRNRRNFCRMYGKTEGFSRLKSVVGHCSAKRFDPHRTQPVETFGGRMFLIGLQMGACVSQETRRTPTLKRRATANAGR